MTLPATREHDPALEVLFHAIDTGALPWPRAGGALFLRARDGWPLHAAGRTGLVCEQTFKPAFDALQRSQLPVHADPVTERFPLVLVLPPRQRDEARALFARAVSQCTDDGVVLACMPNDEGAKTGQSDLAKLAGPVSVLSKQHCRVFWTRSWRSTKRCVRNGATWMHRARSSTGVTPAGPACSRGIASIRHRRCS